MGQMLSQAFPGTAPLTEANAGDQKGRVFIVTGATSGLGKELARILYSCNAKVYVAARSEEKAVSTIKYIKEAHAKSTGEVVYLPLDLDDLRGIKASVGRFLAQEQRLDVLWNNAGIMIPPNGSKTNQGFEKQLGVNALGAFLFTKELTPLLRVTAARDDTPRGSVRVVWLSSSMVQMLAPTGGVDMENLDYKSDKSSMHKYAVSKAANTLYSAEMARRYGDDGIVSVSLDPGNLRTDLQRSASPAVRKAWNLLLNDAINGTYTELFAGLSSEITPDRNNAWVVPYGKFGTLRKDIEEATKTVEAGGSGVALKFWNWSEEVVRPYT